MILWLGALASSTPDKEIKLQSFKIQGQVFQFLWELRRAYWGHTPLLQARLWDTVVS